MYKVINEYMSKVNLLANDDIYRMLKDYLDDVEDIRLSTVTINFNRYVVDIKLKEYSVDNATRVFYDFCRKVSFPYSSMHVRFNEGKCVRYRFLTCKENKDGFYCDIIFS